MNSYLNHVTRDTIVLVLSLHNILLIRNSAHFVIFDTTFVSTKYSLKIKQDAKRGLQSLSSICNNHFGVFDSHF